MRDSTYLGEHNLVRLTGLGNSGRVVAVKTVAVAVTVIIVAVTSISRTMLVPINRNK